MGQPRPQNPNGYVVFHKQLVNQLIQVMDNHLVKQLCILISNKFLTMKEKTIYTGKATFTKFYCDENANVFYLEFDTVFLKTSEFWRYFKNNKIELISNDHNLKYIYNQPKIDIVSQLKKELQDELLICIKISENYDTLFYFTSNKKLKIYVSSMALENWEIIVNGKQYICLQGGSIA